MAQRKGTSARFRAPGIYQWLIDHQKRARDSIDLRLLNWNLSDPVQKAADRAALEYETKLYYRQPSKLLDKLEAGEPVHVHLPMLSGHLPRVRPTWLQVGTSVRTVKVWPDDQIQPADGPPDQCAQQKG